METPCVNICVMSQETNRCEGCARTIDEIVSWSRMTEAERRRIMAELPRRKSKAAR